MLVAHASSTCDVCLESYREDCSYHSIPCGHVFCLPCLISTSPPRCPLCRHDFTSHSMRKVHLTLPSERDMAARKFELKLVQSSPEMSLSEGLVLFQEVQEWLDGAAEDEFLVLRAFAAVLCSFHETKDKLRQMETVAETKEADYLRSLDEARSAANEDATNYKTKYDAATSDIAALRAECASLRAQAESAQQQNAEIQAYHIQEVNALLAQLHSFQIAADFMPASPSPRRVSNPLPTPPRPIDVPYLKLDERRKASSPSQRADTGRIPGSVATAAATTDKNDLDADPLTSAFVPTLSTSITTTRRTSSTTKSRSEVTTLVFRPPKRMPTMWDTRTTSRSSRTVDTSKPSQHHSDGSPRREVHITEVRKRNVESVSQTRSGHTTDEDPQGPQLPSKANVPPRSTYSTSPTRVVVQYTNNDSDGVSTTSSTNALSFINRRNSRSRDLSAVEENNWVFASKPPTSSTPHDISSAPGGRFHANQEDSSVNDASSTLAVTRMEGEAQRRNSTPSRFSGLRRVPSPAVVYVSDSGSADSRKISEGEVDSLQSDLHRDRGRRVSTPPTRKPRYTNEGKVRSDLSNLIQNQGRRGFASSKPAQRRPEIVTPRTGENSFREQKHAAEPHGHQAIRVIRYDPAPSLREIPMEPESHPLRHRAHNNNSGNPWSSHGNLRLVASVHARDGAALETSSVPSRERAYAHAHSYSYPGPPTSLRESRHTNISTFPSDNHITSGWQTAIDSRANPAGEVFISS